MANVTTKVTSFGSTPGAPTVPNPTPRTDASVFPDNVTPPDLEEVGRILGPIQEDLNEQADVAMLPSPPINTPETFSPPPSVYRPARNRGFSLLGDRLAQLKLQERSSPLKDSDVASSNRSIAASIEENEGEQMADTSSTGKLNTPTNPLFRTTASLLPAIPGSIPVALGSPAINPHIEEYVHFSSNDLPVTGPALAPQVVTAHDGAHSRENSIKSVKSDGAASGVTEKSTWAEEVEDAAERSVLQLEQLALDEYMINPTRTVEEYYIDRLERLLTAPGRRVKVKLTKEVAVDTPAILSTKAPIQVSDEAGGGSNKE